MTFEEWWEVQEDLDRNPANEAFARPVWDAAFDEGVKWTLQQDANTLNKLQLTLEED